MSMASAPLAEDLAMTTTCGRDGIVLAIAVAVLLIGTATGNALLMFALATVALAAVLIFFRRRLASTPAIAATIAAAIVVAVGVARILQ
jgi:hypothetical protein